MAVHKFWEMIPRQRIEVFLNRLHRLNLRWFGLKNVIQMTINRRGVATRLGMHLDIEFNAQGFVFLRVLSGFFGSKATVAVLGFSRITFPVNHGFAAKRIDLDGILWFAFLVVAGGRQDGVLENMLGLIEVIHDCGASCGGSWCEAKLALVVQFNRVRVGCGGRRSNFIGGRRNWKELLAEEEHHDGSRHCSVGMKMGNHGCGCDILIMRLFSSKR
mmetsp:Transcript_15342/g.32196  ORF Transcript_15342/g.32196 Transcript_15342/m.32196 type:complete len:216 (-) Transcript_15342:55-702(-)